MGTIVLNLLRKNSPHTGTNRKNSKKTNQLAVAVPVNIIASAIKPAIAKPRIKNPRKVITTAVSLST